MPTNCFVQHACPKRGAKNFHIASSRSTFDLQISRGINFNQYCNFMLLFKGQCSKRIIHHGAQVHPSIFLLLLRSLLLSNLEIDVHSSLDCQVVNSLRSIQSVFIIRTRARIARAHMPAKYTWSLGSVDVPMQQQMFAGARVQLLIPETKYRAPCSLLQLFLIFLLALLHVRVISHHTE